MINRIRVRWIVSALLLIVGHSLATCPAVAQQELPLLDLGTIDLETLKTFHIIPGFFDVQGDSVVYVDVDGDGFGPDVLFFGRPSVVHRPLDMFGSRGGARSWGLGGAVSASAEGLESVAWNPAGLSWLVGRELRADLAWSRPSGTTSGAPEFIDVPGIDVLDVTGYEVDLSARVRYSKIGAAISGNPLFSIPWTGAVTFRRYLDMTYPEDLVAEFNSQEGASIPVILAFDATEDGGVDALTGTLALQVVPRVLSVGANINSLSGKLRITEEARLSAGGEQIPTGTTSMGFDYKGFSVDLGAQAHLGERAKLGVRFTPGYTLEVRKGFYRATTLATTQAQQSFAIQAKIADYDLEIPSLLTFGGAVRPIRQLWVSADMNMQAWSDLKLDYVEDVWTSTRTLPLRDATIFHLGLEWRSLEIKGIDLPIRFGYRSGPLSLAQLDPPDDPLQIGRNDPDGVEANEIVGFRAVESDWGGGDVDATGYSFGFGLETGALRYDVAYDVLDYELTKFYFEAPEDAIINPGVTLINVDRRDARLLLSATMHF